MSTTELLRFIVSISFDILIALAAYALGRRHQQQHDTRRRLIREETLDRLRMN